MILTINFLECGNSSLGALLDSTHSALALEFLPLLLDIGRKVTSQPMRQSSEVTGKITPGIPDLELWSEILLIRQ
jgi:hypothetical protein